MNGHILPQNCHIVCTSLVHLPLVAICVACIYWCCLTVVPITCLPLVKACVFSHVVSLCGCRPTPVVVVVGGGAVVVLVVGGGVIDDEA